MHWYNNGTARLSAATNLLKKLALHFIKDFRAKHDQRE
jgi:hypothetical protein